VSSATERPAASGEPDTSLLKWLTCLMFLMFAMTSDAVGSVIPAVIDEFHLSMKAAGAFHYVPMAAIAGGALLFGFLADGLGHKRTILLGLGVYGVGSLLFAFGARFAFFVSLLAVSGVGVSIFKTGALALIGDLAKSTTQHTSLLNTIEGCFGVGAIIGPTLVALLSVAGISWKWLYVIAAAICALLIVIAASVRYPHGARSRDPVDFRRTLRMIRNPYALGFSLLIMLYVAVEVAIYVWMPTYVKGYRGSPAWLPAYALTAFFVLRAAGRFLSAWMLRSCSWTALLALCGVAIFCCFAGALSGADAGIFLLPLSGLFMSTIYPTLNSKGISCFTKAEHGAVAGVILFFTAVAAALGPLAMAAVSDAYGDVRYGFVLAGGFASLLMLGLVFNWLANPAKRRLQQLDRAEYGSLCG
jgi:DHA1 family quinolone resistance protein-like MFS transporter